MTTLYLILSLFTATAHASDIDGKDDWMCKEVDSERHGQSVYQCGNAEGASEKQAREFAYNEAEGTFDQRCNLSSDCRHSKINREPKRTTCEKINRNIPGGEYLNQWRCYQLIVFTIEG